MSNDPDRAADQRVEWGLAEAVGHRTAPDVTEQVVERLRAEPTAGPTAEHTAERAAERRPTSRPWLQAAAVLLSISVVVTVSLLTNHDDTASQRDEPKPRAAHIKKHDDIARLPKDVRNVVVHRASDRDLKALASFGKLEWFSIRGEMTYHNIDGSYVVESGSATAEGLRALLATTKLRELDLTANPTISGEAVADIAKQPRLEQLSLALMHTPNDALAHLTAMTSLRELDLKSNHGFDDAGLRHVARIPGLRWLSLESCGRLTAAGLSHLVELKSLEHLDLNSVDGTPWLFGWVAGPLSTLKDPEAVKAASEKRKARTPKPAGDGVGVTDAVLQKLSALPKLRELRIAECPSITREGIRSLASFPLLRSLDLSKSQLVEASLITSLPKSLETLFLSECPGVDDEVLEAIASHLPALRELHIRKTGVTAVGLTHLLDRLPMRVLNIGTCSQVTADLMPALRNHLTLEELFLFGLDWVGDEELKELRAMPQMRQVRR